MISSIKEINEYCVKYNISQSELISLLINLEGINVNLNVQRVRFSLSNLCDNELLFSVQNTLNSKFKIRDNQLIFDNTILGGISNLCEDSCEVFYTRNKGKVLCFNPNSRSSCKGCKFCYTPKSSDDDKTISIREIHKSLKQWLDKEKLNSLAHIEQIAVVTGCFNNDKLIVEYLLKLKQSASKLDFEGELLFFGTPVEESTIYQLEKIKPLNLCFTVECFENRDMLISKGKNINLDNVINQMNIAKGLGIKTNFSYIVGLDSLLAIKENFGKVCEGISCFPIISIFQTDPNRIKIRNTDANFIDYYLKTRQVIEDVMEESEYRPKTWNNHRSLWRQYFKSETLQE